MFQTVIPEIGKVDCTYVQVQKSGIRYLTLTGISEKRMSEGIQYQGGLFVKAVKHSRHTSFSEVDLWGHTSTSGGLGVVSVPDEENKVAWGCLKGADQAGVSIEL